MATQVWARNPRYYIKECLEAGVTRFSWNLGYVRNRHLDVDKFVRLYLSGQPYEMLVVDIANRRAAEVCQDCTSESPCRYLPVWAYGDPWDSLEGSISAGAVVVTDVPTERSVGSAFLRALGDFQKEFPESFIHVHGVYAYRLAFGFGFSSADLDFRELAAMGRVQLPSGLIISESDFQAHRKWIELLGMRVSHLKVPRNRCLYNIRAGLWAAENFRKNIKFLVRDVPINPDSIDFDVPQATRIMLKNIKPVDGDRFLCDACSVSASCRYFRVGSVCSVPDAEINELAQMFGTRDSDSIIDGLGKLLEIQVNRFGKGIDAEEDRVDPEVSKLGTAVFDQGVKLAKLVDPSLAANGKTTNNILAVGSVSGQSARELMGSIAKELEARGVRREDITPEMIRKVLDLPEPERAQAIEVTASEAAS